MMYYIFELFQALFFQLQSIFRDDDNRPFIEKQLNNYLEELLSQEISKGEFLLSDTDEYSPNKELESDLEADLDPELEDDGTNNSDNESGVFL